MTSHEALPPVVEWGPKDTKAELGTVALDLLIDDESEIEDN